MKCSRIINNRYKRQVYLPPSGAADCSAVIIEIIPESLDRLRERLDLLEAEISTLQQDSQIIYTNSEQINSLQERESLLRRELLSIRRDYSRMRSILHVNRDQYTPAFLDNFYAVDGPAQVETSNSLDDLDDLQSHLSLALRKMRTAEERDRDSGDYYSGD